MSKETQEPEGRQLPVPVPLDPAAAEGTPWLRGARAADAVGEVDDGDASSSELVPVPAPTVDDVRATAIDIVVDIDAAIAGLQAMRAHALAGLGHLAVEEANAAHLDAGIAMRDLANEVALRQRRSDRTVGAEIDRAMRILDHWPATLKGVGRDAHPPGPPQRHHRHRRTPQDPGGARRVRGRPAAGRRDHHARTAREARPP